MSARVVSLGLVALLAGCSFIQSWNDYRPGGETDAGMDSGNGDAGECNYCPGSCDPGDRTICVLDPADGCYFCDFRGGVEGDRCGADEDCAGALICEYGRCLMECFGPAGCGESSLGDRCVQEGRAVCLDHECDPVGMSCRDDSARCYLGLPIENPEEAASICAFHGPGLQPEGERCSEDQPCADGLTCVEPPGGGGDRLCRAWCYLAEGCPDGTMMCFPVELSPGVGLRYAGRDLGVCHPPPAGCVPACMAGQICLPGGTCGDCATTADCTGPGESCLGGRCVAGGCGTDSDCATPTNRCFGGGCTAECTSDAFCGSLGFDHCANVSTGAYLCVNSCDPSMADCPPGQSCMDRDGDSRFECDG